MLETISRLLGYIQRHIVYIIGPIGGHGGAYNTMQYKTIAPGCNNRE